VPNGWSSEQKLKILVICTTVRRNFAAAVGLVVLESGTYHDLVGIIGCGFVAGLFIGQ